MDTLTECIWCDGTGLDHCRCCYGSAMGYTEDGRCLLCRGTGTERCKACNGTGRVEDAA